MTGRTRNPQARREWQDTLTGARTRAGAPGARPSGRLVTRVRPAADRGFETVIVDPEDLAPERDTFGIDPDATEGLRRSAARASSRRPSKPLERDADLDLGRAGASTTFNSPKTAAELFMRNNPAIFEHPVFESADLFDATKDFMDGVEVRQGKRFVRLSRTPRGEEILSGGTGGAIAKDMLAYLFGQAGKHRRWRDVPWSMVDGYVDRIADVMQDEAQRQGVVSPAGGVQWYPLSSGVYPPEEVVTLAVDELGEAKAQRLADWLNSQSLYDLADRLDDVLHPPKGSKGKGARRAKKCLGKAERATVRRRVTLLRHWAAHPDEVPTWACVASRETESTAVPVCMFPAVEDEVRRTMAACDVAYDPNWPIAEHEIRCGRGEADESGLPPAPCPDDDERYEADDDVPWENPSRVTKINDGVYEYEGHRIEIRRGKGRKNWTTIVTTPDGETWEAHDVKGTRDQIALQAARFIGPKAANPDDDDEDEDLSDAPASYRAFSEWIKALKRRRTEFIAEHREIFKREGIVAVPGYDGRYTLVLTRGTTSPYRVTDFLGDEPVGHSERDTLDEALEVLWQDATSDYAQRPPQPRAGTNPRARNPSQGRASRIGRRIANV